MGSGHKILLVEDDKDDQFFFKEAIKELELTLEYGIASNGLEALDYLKKVIPLPSLIFLDLNMPMMNGFECLEQLKKTNEYKEIPVIIFTTSNHPKDEERTLEMGAKMFITKPCDFNDLKNILQAIFQTFALGV